MSPPILRLSGVVRTHSVGSDTIRSLDGIDLEVSAGDYLAIVGRSGSGKTSLLNMLGLLDVPTDGQIFLHGKEVTDIRPDERAALRNRHVGFIFQSFNLLSRVDALDNVQAPLMYRGIPSKTRRDLARRALDDVGLSERLHHTARQLSGGEQQRVAIARALVGQPDLLLADEPTGALDTATAAVIMDTLDRLHKAGKTIILVTHDQEVAAHASRVVEMRDGSIIKDTSNKSALMLRDPPVPAGSSANRESVVGPGLWACVRMALESFKASPLRSALTVLGVVIGVAAVITMISVGRGAQEQVEMQINSLGANLLLVESGLRDNAAPGERPVKLTEDDARAISVEIPGVDVSAPTVSGTLSASFGNQRRATSLAGITHEYLIAREWEVVSGRSFVEAEMASPEKVALIGATLAEELLPDRNPVGEVIRLNDTPVRIIGLLERKGQSPNGIDQDNIVLVPMTTAKLRLLGAKGPGERKAIRYALVKVQSDDLLEPVSEQIAALLKARNRRHSAHYDVTSLGSIFAAKEETSRSLTILLAAVASVSLAVGGISIMNIMLVSVTERTREIGLRLALGARPRDIRRQFLVESATLSVFGGVIGLVLGLALASGIGVIAGWPIIVEPAAVALAAGFSAAVGLVFGYLPARRAASLDPIAALRIE
nr:ABC transporter permease [Tropicimonas marinistellae]